MKNLANLNIINLRKGERKRRIEIFSNSPLTVEWNITEGCNLQCKHCWIEASNSPPIFRSLSEYKKVVDAICSLGAIQLTISGGEPLFYNELTELVSYCYRRGLVIEIDTNGTLLTEKLCKRYSPMKDRVQFNISVDGSCATAHSKLRVDRTSFRKMIRGIKRLKKENLAVRASTVISPSTSEIDSIYTLLKELQVTNWFVSNIHPHGRALKLFNTTMQWKDYVRKCVDLFWKLHLLNQTNPQMNIDFPLNFRDLSMPLSKRSLICEQDSLRKGFAIDSRGEILACSRIQESKCGNVFQHEIIDLWKKCQQDWLWKTRVDDLEDCKICGVKGLCGGGCRVNAKNLTGSYYTCDPIAKELVTYVLTNYMQQLNPREQATIRKMLEIK
jgi:radical SAM protein with 4Fe4S-binding SPASM domain